MDPVPQEDFIVCAHRGTGERLIENTISSLCAAYNLGADMIETDVRITKDNKLVLVTDPDINGHLVKDHSYEDLLKEQPNLTLVSDLLSKAQQVFLDNSIPIILEIKDINATKLLMKLLTKYKKLNIIITSFNVETITITRSINEKIPIGLILGSDYHYSPEQLEDIINNLDITWIIPHQKMLAKFLMNPISKKTKIIPWTINDPKQIRKYINDPRVDGIITDEPFLAVELKCFSI